MSGILSVLAGIKTAIATAVDTYFNLTTLLLSGDGTNGAQNNTFLDSSTNNFSITRNGNTTQGTFSPFSQTGWGNFFNGSTDYLTTATNAALAYGSSDFTFETFAYFPSNSSANSRLLGNWAGTWSSNFWSLHSNHSSYVNKFSFFVYNYNSSSAMLVSTSTTPLNQWVHIAVTRSGSTWRLFINGALEATQTSSVSIDGGTTDDMYIGGTGVAAEYSNSYLSSVRVTKGGALYTSAFTPSTTPLTTTVSAGTVSLLTCQGNRFVDASANAIAITPSGTPSVQAFSPFAPTAAYSAATNGGSGYFDGTGDYLQLADSTSWDLTGDYTIEMWLYSTATPVSTTFFQIGDTSNYLVIYLSSATKYITTAGSLSITASTALALNTWNHFALVRNGAGSNNTVLYLNGVNVGQATNTTSFTGSASNGVRIGAEYPSNYYYNGYIAGARIVKGTAVYTAAFTPPTAPPTAVTNTQLLANFTNGGIIDATAKNDLETVGNAQISTTQSKWGGSAIYFDGTGDGLYFKASPLFAFGTGDFTVEFWLYSNANQANFTKYFCTGTSAGNLVIDQQSTTNTISVNNNATVYLTSSSAFSNSTWTHVAVVRYSGTLYIYFNGTSVGSVANSTNFTADTVGSFGCYPDSTKSANAYFDDVRVTRYARYTANFTAPTAAFPLQ